MPCVYLPGPAPAVTVANRHGHAASTWDMQHLKINAWIILDDNEHLT